MPPQPPQKAQVPVQTQEPSPSALHAAAEKRLSSTVKDELLPLLNVLKDLLVRLEASRSFPFQLYSSKLNTINDEYSELAAKFFDVNKKLSTPDILFSGLTVENDPENAATIASVYMGSEEVLMKRLSEGSGYVEIIDRTLDRKLQSIQNSRTFILAAAALVISLVVSVIYTS